MTTITTQLLYMRECLVLFYGNEISVGILLFTWLSATGLGSFTASAKRSFLKQPLALARLLILLSIMTPLTYLAIQTGGVWLNTNPGEMPGLGPMILFTVCTLAPFCFVSGLIYPVACRSIQSVYVLEAAGSGIGGLLLSLFLFPNFDTPQILLGFSLIIGCCGVFLLTPQHKKKLLVGILLVLLLIILFIPLTKSRLIRWTRPESFTSAQVLIQKNTAYNHIKFTKQAEQLSLFQNGLLSWTIPNDQTAEEAVHYALLQHPGPTSVLMIGAGPEGPIREVLKHNSVNHIYYTEPDAQYLQILKKHLPHELNSALKNPRVNLLNQDARAFLKKNDRAFDVVILNLPNPYTAQINRFYTLEFFQLLRRNLTPAGVVAVSLRASENLIGPELADFLNVMVSTIQTVFPYVELLPGETLRLFASENPASLTCDADTLSARLTSRKISTRFVRDYYILDQFSSERVEGIKEQIKQTGGSRINRDFSPIGYYYDTVLWATHFSSWFKFFYLAFNKISPIHILLVGSFFAVLFMLWARNKDQNQTRKSLVRLSVLAVGFTEISLEFILIMVYQIWIGHLYPGLAIIVAAYMLGLGLGAWLYQSKSSVHWENFTFYQACMGLLPLLISGFLFGFEFISHFLGAGIGVIVCSILTATAGWIGGSQFILANRLSSKIDKNPAGKLYGLDLIGSSGGALLTGGFLVPLFGLTKTLGLLTLLNALIFGLIQLNKKNPD